MFIVGPVALLQVQVKEAVGPVPSSEEARLRRLVSRIPVGFYLCAARAALLEQSPFVPQMALAVAMVTRVAVGRRVLPALVDGGHLSFVLFRVRLCLLCSRANDVAEAKVDLGGGM